MNKGGRVHRIRETDEERELREAQEASQKAQQEKESLILRRAFGTADGRRALQIIMKRCKYQSPITAVTADGVIHTENLQHNAALQGLYLWLRKYVDKDVLAQVEVTGFPEEGEN